MKAKVLGEMGRRAEGAIGNERFSRVFAVGEAVLVLICVFLKLWNFW